MKKAVTKLLAITSLLVLSACGSGVSGTYSDESGAMELKFESGGKAIQSTFGIQMEMKYEVDGDKVKLISPQGTLVMTKQADGSIVAGPLVLKKKN